MAETEMEFSDFITDKDGDYSRAQFMALADRLLREGRRPDRVFLAMYLAAAEASIAHSILEHREFIKTVEKDVIEYLPELERGIDKILEEEEVKKMEAAIEKLREERAAAEEV